MPNHTQQITDLVKDDRIEEAIDQLINITKALDVKREHRSALLLSADYKQYEEKMINDTLSEAQLQTEIASIRARILEIVDNLPVDAEPDAPGKKEASHSRLDRAFNIAIKIVLLLLLLISVGVLVMGVMVPALSPTASDVTDSRIFLFGVSTTGIASSAIFYPRFAKQTA